MNTGLRNGTGGDARYTKDQLLNIYQIQKETGFLKRNLSDVFQGPWNPLAQEKSESKDQAPGPEVCWNSQPDRDPFGLVDMDENERQVCQMAGQ